MVVIVNKRRCPINVCPFSNLTTAVNLNKPKNMIIPDEHLFKGINYFLIWERYYGTYLSLIKTYNLNDLNDLND